MRAQPSSGLSLDTAGIEGASIIHEIGELAERFDVTNLEFMAQCHLGLLRKTDLAAAQE